MTPDLLSPLISASQLESDLRSAQPPQVFDCSFELADASAGSRQFEQVHIAGAVHAHLERDLSASEDATAASGGRHPLPQPAVFLEWLASTGLQNGQTAVVYDRQGNNYCGRLWWMLEQLGIPTRLLDGGLAAWQAAGGATETGIAHAREKTDLKTQYVQYQRSLFATQNVVDGLRSGSIAVIDARAPGRFRGEVEPLDPVAGHIPGALNRPFALNMAPDGRFHPADALRAAFETLLAGRDPACVVHHCGSGVSALPNLIAMRIAGLGASNLYAGSWSEWCTTPGLPVARG